MPEARPRYYYRDFETGKRHFTRGIFTGWAGPMGPLSVYYAMFTRQTDDLFLPEYCLEKETCRLLSQTPITDGALSAAHDTPASP